MTPDDRYARYTRLTFDRPHPKVLRITMSNGKMNTAGQTMHTELGEIWRDIDADPTVNVAIITGAGKVFSAGGDFSMIDEFETRARGRVGVRPARRCVDRDQGLPAGVESIATVPISFRPSQ